jgi:hypothetical protein
VRRARDMTAGIRLARPTVLTSPAATGHRFQTTM